MEARILLVEDDIGISEMIKGYLQKEGFSVTTAENGEEGLLRFSQEVFDMVVLDLMMPKLDGMEVMRVIREKSSIPIMIMSARDSDVDKAIGLGLGADDYISKPFSMIEFVARIKATLRRVRTYSVEKTIVPQFFEINDIKVDLENYSVLKAGTNLKLTSKEFDILKLFIKNPSRVFTKAQIYASVWNDEYYGDENVINVHMRRLREKIEDDASNPKIIKTIWGIGYKLGVD